MGERSEPLLTVMVGGEALPITRDDIVIYRHLGANALYDHCFIAIDDQETPIIIWRHNDNYDEISRLAEDNQSQMIVNIAEPSDHDKEMYFLHVSRDLKEATTLPEDWL